MAGRQPLGEGDGGHAVLAKKPCWSGEQRVRMGKKQKHKLKTSRAPLPTRPGTYVVVTKVAKVSRHLRKQPSRRRKLPAGPASS